MKREDIPAPREGVIVTHFLVVRDQDTSREWYRDVLGAEVVNERESAFLNLRVADIQQFYEEWSSRGAEFLTPPIDRRAEIRCYIRDPDGHLIEVGQATGFLEGFVEVG
jgi:catechol 2,3-dioxygenase-like lactoylglutathione lyase family enzyme